MSHITCPYCGSNEHTTGYGLAAGPMGNYTFCDSCDELIEFDADIGGLSDEHVARLAKMQDEFNAKLNTARAARAAPADKGELA